MRKVVSRWTLLLGCLSGTVLAQPVTQQAQQQLLEQVRIGEATSQADLVRDSLARLQLIAPDHPQVLLGEIRQALLHSNQPLVEQRLQQLRRQAPESTELRQAQGLIKLQSQDGQQQLQQARLLAAAGRAEEAATQYQLLFGNEPPDFASTLEYWSVRSNISGQHPAVIQQLQSLDKQYPGNPRLRQLLASLLFVEQRNTEALAILHQLAGDPLASNAAAEREYNYLSKLPVGRETARSWEDFQRYYPSSPHQNEAAKQLQHQRQLLNDPYWQAGVTGQKRLEEGDPIGAESLLRRASRSYPNDASLSGSLGMALLRQKKYEAAHAAFTNALSKEQDTSFISKWQDLQRATRSWMLLQKGDKALARKDLVSARKAYIQARQIKPEDADGLVGLSNVALAEGQNIQAEALLLQARKLQPDNGQAVRALVRLYQTQSTEKAQSFLDTLPTASQRDFAALRQSLELEQLNNQAAAATQRSDWATASQLLLKARKLAPDDPWLTYRLAGAMRKQGQNSAADASFQQLIQRQGHMATVRYAHGLYLASIGRDSEALSTLSVVPVTAWDTDMHALANRVTRRQLLAKTETLRDAGQESEAIALLLRNPTTDDLLTLAGWAYQRDDQAQAQAYYQQVLQREPGSSEAQLGLIESLLASGKRAPAKQALEHLVLPANTSAAYQRRLASAWVAVDEPDKARMLYTQLLKTPQTNPLVYRDVARLQSKQEPQSALDNYAHSMAAAGLITPAQATPRDDRAMTLASREQESDEWLARSLRSDVAALYQEQNPALHLYHDFAWRTDSAAAGISDLLTQTTILRLDAPLAEGHGFLQTEQIEMDVDNFATDSDGKQRELFGYCAAQLRNKTTGALTSGCPDTSESTSGTTFAMGWNNERWALDLGYSPEGFEVENWLGGVSYSSDWRSLGWTLTASRRPMSNSVVSYAGAVDPITGITWGGVTSNGVTLGLSYDKGDVDGVWTSLGSHWLRGTNVADNHRGSAMAGYYYRLIDRVDERLRTGLTVMYWSYDKDLSEYTFGQGGYYSPKQYYSVSVPLNYAWRNADWSVLLESSLGWSYAKISENELYPLGAPPGYAFAEDTTLVKAGSSSNGVSVHLQGLFERRLSDNLVLGSGISWQHSEDYAPSRVLLYLRYTFDDWQGNLPLPIAPIGPYAEMR